MGVNENATRAGADPSRAGAQAILHASAVAVGGIGILLLGPSGAGKSALAIRLLALGASLVADDRVILRVAGSLLVAESPPALAGLIEARGIGILRMEARRRASIGLVVDLARAPEARLPQRRKIVLLGRNLPLIFGRDVPNLEAVLSVMAQGRGGVA